MGADFPGGPPLGGLGGPEPFVQQQLQIAQVGLPSLAATSLHASLQLTPKRVVTQSNSDIGSLSLS